MNNFSGMEKVRRVLAKMILDHKLNWWGYAISTFDIKESTHIDTAALSYNSKMMRPEILFNSKFFENMNLGEVAAILLHELGHFLQMAFERRALRDPLSWNIATDACDNFQLENDIKQISGVSKLVDSIKLPENAIRLPKDFNPKDAYSEFVYSHKDEKGGGNDGKGGSSGGLGEMFDQVQKGQTVLIDDHSQWGNFNDISEEELKNAVRDVIESATKAVGYTPGSASSLLEKLNEVKISWRQVLRSFTGQNQRIGFRGTWKRPNRRFGSRRPGKTVKRSGILVFLLDTSGSMSSQELSQALTEIDYVSKTYECWVIDCDAEVHRVYKYRRGLPLEAKGRGGTNMNPGLKVAQEELHADMIVCITDGGLFNNPISTKAPQLWVITENGSPNVLKDKRWVQMQS